MDFTLIPPDVFTTVGVVGFALYVTNYALLTTRVLSGDCVAYFSLNLVAATLVLIGLTVNFNLASALIQGFWVIMSLFAISLRLFRPHHRSRR